MPTTRRASSVTGRGAAGGVQPKVVRNPLPPFALAALALIAALAPKNPSPPFDNARQFVTELWFVALIPVPPFRFAVQLLMVEPKAETRHRYFPKRCSS
jgi:hypothetical protein